MSIQMSRAKCRRVERADETDKQASKQRKEASKQASKQAKEGLDCRNCGEWFSGSGGSANGSELWVVAANCLLPRPAPRALLLSALGLGLLTLLAHSGAWRFVW